LNKFESSVFWQVNYVIIARQLLLIFKNFMIFYNDNCAKL